MVCPVCTVAVGAGVGFLREFGVSDLITGIWFGALIISSIMWMIDFLNRKNIHFLFRKILVIVSFYAIFILPLYFWKVGGAIVMTPLLLKGVIWGTFIFILGVLASNYLKKINEGKVLIFYQKIIVPLVFLIIASIIAHLIILISTV
jgi:hypothetical protein